jgi:hypothetical protein
MADIGTWGMWGVFLLIFGLAAAAAGVVVGIIYVADWVRGWFR